MLLEQERAKAPKERFYEQRPPYPLRILSKPYPERYKPRTFVQYDGKRGSAIEHVSKFINTLDPYAAGKDLCLQEFSKSLCDCAYTWYTDLKPGSIPTWDDMVDVFCTKYFHGEETVTLATLQATKQRSDEDLMEYIKRFSYIALDCYNHCEEKTLVEMCMGNIIAEYRAVLENLEISQFVQLLQNAKKIAQSVRPSSDRPKERRPTPQAIAVSTSERKRKSDVREYETPLPLPRTPKELDVLLDKWIIDGVFKPNQVSREPTEEERIDPRFCHLHNYMQHPTTECSALRKLVHRKIKKGTLELSQLEVQKNLLSNYKGKGVAAVIICADLREDEEERPALPIAVVTTLQKSSRFKNLWI